MTSSLSGKIWRAHSLNTALSTDLSTALDVPLAIAHVLSRRGVKTVGDGELFFTPSLELLRFTENLKDLKQAIAVMEQAISQNLPVTVYGDYDVDGITGVALLCSFLTELGLHVNPYIPDRLTEGYGVNREAIDRIYGQHMEDFGTPGVLITVDCGISDYEAVAHAKSRNILVIITDHHRPPARLPEADAVINPHRVDCPFPDKSLAGVGVAFYFLMGLRTHLNHAGFWSPGKMPNLKELLPLVALGTIADQVPLLGVNRTLVRAGLEVINHRLATGNLNPGLAALITSASSGNFSNITSEDVAFRLGPRINAAGRVGRPETALQLLLTDDYDEAASLAAILEQENLARREIEKQIYDQADELAESDAGKKSLVLWGEGWHPGVIGIVASRISEKYWKPTILFAVNGDEARGSGRSLPGLDLHKMLTLCDREILERFGGHAGAAGMRIDRNYLKRFRKNFDEVVLQNTTDDLFTPILRIDQEVIAEEIFADTFLTNYIRLFPFGNGNPEPLFVLKGCRLDGIRTIGADGSHLRFTLHDNGRSIQGVGFNWGKHASQFAGGKMDIACRLRENEFRGRRRWEVLLVDAAIHIENAHNQN